MNALRKVYHRAVQITLDNVERLWEEPEAFKTNSNRTTSKKFMADLSQGHMQARTVLCHLSKPQITSKFLYHCFLSSAGFGRHAESLSQLEMVRGEYFRNRGERPVHTHYTYSRCIQESCRQVTDVH